MTERTHKYRADMAEVEREYIRYLPDPNTLIPVHYPADPMLDDPHRTYSLWKPTEYDYQEVRFETIYGIYLANKVDPKTGANYVEQQHYVTWKQIGYHVHDVKTLAGRVRILKEIGFSSQEIQKLILNGSE